MTLAQLIMAGAVFLLGIPAAFRNPTAFALVAAYFVVQGLWMTTGAALPWFVLFAIDLACLAVIYLKAPVPHPWCRVCRCEVDVILYRSFPHQLCALWLERSRGDRFVIVCFPAAWWLYLADGVSPWVQWHGLYFLALAQLLAAAGESYLHFRSSRAAKAGDAEAANLPSSGLEFAMARGWAGDG